MKPEKKYVKIISSPAEAPRTESGSVVINNQDITITANGIYTADEGYTGIGVATVNVPTSGGNITSLNVIPSTSAQQITASGGVDGYSPVNVSAVTSSIDANIQAGNIKNGVSILGVVGNYTGGGGSAVIEPLPITPTTSAQTITASGGVDGYSPISVAAVTAAIDNNIVAGNIKSGVSILGVSGNVVELKGETKTVTPTTSQQTITPTTPTYNGLTSVTVNAVTSSIDANITAGNIKSGVTILGVTGNYSGGGGMTRSYINYNGELTPSLTEPMLDLTGITTITEYALANAYKYSINLPTNLDLSGITTIKDYGCYGMFEGSHSITNVNMSGLTSIGYPYAIDRMFYGSSISSIDMSGLTSITASFPAGTFNGRVFGTCINLTSVTFPALAILTGNRSLYYWFYECSSLTSLSFPALTSTSFGSYTSQFSNMLSGCSGVTVHFPSNLQSVIGSWNDVVNGFAGTNTTVLFDLPATT